MSRSRSTTTSASSPCGEKNSLSFAEHSAGQNSARGTRFRHARVLKWYLHRCRGKGRRQISFCSQSTGCLLHAKALWPSLSHRHLTPDVLIYGHPSCVTVKRWVGAKMLAPLRSTRYRRLTNGRFLEVIALDRRVTCVPEVLDTLSVLLAQSKHVVCTVCTVLAP